MPRVVHFELAVDDSSRAIAFYQNVFGWKAAQWGDEPYWMLTTGEAGQPGIDGAFTSPRENWPALVNILDVASADDTTAAIEANGGKVVVPKMPIPGVGYVAYCQDTEGNIFGIMQDDPTVQPA